MISSEDCQDASFNDWARAKQSALITDLASHLDVEAGLHEILLTSRHATVLDDITNKLDIEGGLSAIVAEPASAGRHDRVGFGILPTLAGLVTLLGVVFVAMHVAVFVAVLVAVLVLLHAVWIAPVVGIVYAVIVGVSFYRRARARTRQRASENDS